MANKKVIKNIVINLCIIATISFLIILNMNNRKGLLPNSSDNSKDQITISNKEKGNQGEERSKADVNKNTLDNINPNFPGPNYSLPDRFKIPSSLIYSINEPVEQDNFTITLTDVKKGKSLTEFGISESDLKYEHSEIEDDGFLVYEEDIFIFIKITMENNLSEESDKYVFYFLEENEGNHDTAECMYRSNIQSKGKAYYKYVFNPKETVEFIFGYIVDKENDNENLLLALSDGFYNPNVTEWDQNYIAINS